MTSKLVVGGLVEGLSVSWWRNCQCVGDPFSKVGGLSVASGFAIRPSGG